MRKFLFFCLIGLLLIPPVTAERKKVGLVLGGGGAKGVAHIGVLKVLEEAGIPIDYIAGTSMGAIVGGLYAVGYGAHEIDSMVRVQDWSMLLSDRVKRSSLTFPEKENAERYIFSIPFGGLRDVQISGMVQGRNLQNLFSNLTVGYHDSVDFNQLKIPFACVAYDVVDGQEKVFRSGSLPQAMRASMAIPAVFAPVRLDSMVLVDGGIKNNYPVDVVRAMGADLIIGVDLGSSDLKMLERLNTPWDVIAQIVALNGYDKYSANKDHTDLLLRPKTSPYTSASFTEAALDTLIRRGEQVGHEQWDAIMDLKRQIGLPDSTDTTVPVFSPSRPLASTDTFFIRKIYFEGVEERDEKWLTQISGLKENSPITVEKLQEAMSIVVGTNAYSNVSYKLRGEKQEDLVLTVQPKSMSAVNFGVNFNTEEIVSLLLNVNLDYRSRYHSKFAVTGRIGKRIYGRLDYAIEQSPLRNFNFAYMFSYNDLDVFSQGEKVVNTTYRHHFLELGYSDMNWLNFKLKVGLRYDYFDYNSFLYTAENQNYKVSPEGFISYFAQAHLETLDRSYFPSRGVSLEADYSIYTDNFVTYKGHTFFSALRLNFLSVLPLTSHLSLLPSASGRVLIGRDAAYPFLNVVGGDMSERYLPQQLAFAGINHIEIFKNSVVILGLNLRQRIGQRHFISLIANYGLHEDSFFDLFKGESVWGGSLGYAYNSVFGPINTSFGLSNRNRKVQFFLNLGYSF